jgi:acetoin utilization protein AcuC
MSDPTLQTQRKLGIFYGPELLEYDFGPEHPFSPTRALLTFELIQAVDLLKQPHVKLYPATLAERELLYLFHRKDFVDFVQNACLRGYGFLDGGDTPAMYGGLEAGLQVVGTSCAMVEAIMRGEIDYAFTIVGGLHHAHPGRASGFCIFNDLAVAIKKLQRDWGIKRVAYIDIDAHHGDGVMYGFYDDPNVLTVDFHEDGRYLFPGTGQQNELGRGEAELTKFNLAMPPYSSDQSFIGAFDRLVPDLLRQFKPEFILLQTGVDAHGGDPLSEMNYSAASYFHTVKSLKTLAGELGHNRLAVFGGGGYSLSTCALRWTQVATELAGVALPDIIPTSWREVFNKTTKTEAPTTFEEDFTTDNTSERVIKIAEWLREKASL